MTRLLQAASMFLLGWLGIAARGMQNPPSPWTGSWGIFRETAPRRYDGAGVVIADCNGSRCSFAIHVSGKGNGDASGYLEAQSETSATAHLIAFGKEHCTLQLKQSADSMTISAGAGDCTYFQTPGVTFTGDYVLRSHEVFSSDDMAECFTSKNPQELAVCTSVSLTAKRRQWELLFDQVDNLSHGNGSDLSTRQDEERKRILLRCDGSASLTACLEEAFAQSSLALEKQRADWLASVTAPGNDADAARHAALLQGKYRHRFRNGDISGDNFFSTDRLHIQTVSGNRIQYSLYLEFYNGHECNMEGTASWRAAGFFVDQRTVPIMESNHDPLASQCIFEIRSTNSGITFADPTGACRMMSCGARGGYNGAGFKFTDRVPSSKSAAKAK